MRFSFLHPFLNLAFHKPHCNSNHGTLKETKIPTTKKAVGKITYGNNLKFYITVLGLYFLKPFQNDRAKFLKYSHRPI
jgi:hypothetical protein